MNKLSFAIFLALAASAQAQNTVADDVEKSRGSGTADKFVPDASVPLTYVGSNARVGVSINDDGDLSGEGLGIFRYTGRSALYGEGWLGRGGAGGLELGLNWLVGAKSVDDAINSPDKLWVAKSFLAVDRNSERDRKATVGFGVEKNDLAFTGYVSKGLSDERFVSTRNSSVTDSILGTLNGRPTTQRRVVTTIFDSFEEVYETSYGARLGKYFDAHLLRLRGGLDFARGDFDADQLTASVGVDKYFEGTPHSVSVDVAHLSRDGQFVSDDSDTQAALTYRYNFGNSFRPAAWEASMASEVGDTPARAAVPKMERVAVETKADLDSDAFFDFDRSSIREETKVELDRLVALLKTAKIVGAVKIGGHTCSIGSETYNNALSDRRAKAVEDYFLAAGVTVEMESTGFGELEPTFPNDTRENRKKNRRVDVTFVSIEESFEEREVPGTDGPVTISKRQVTVPPGWIERALRTPAEHRREVDTYQYTTTRTETALDAPVFVNRGPIAVNDTFTVRRNAPATTFTVLSNDSDPDGDGLRVVGIPTAPRSGVASFTTAGVSYTPNANFVGVDTFTYEMTDGTLRATATVTITVLDQGPQATDDTVNVNRGASIDIAPLANDRDPNGEALSLTGIDAASRGTATRNGNSVTYAAPADFVGTVTIPYRIANASGSAASARIIINVLNRLPVAGADTAATAAGRPVTISVLGNDSDPDGDTLTLTAVSTPRNGTARIENGTVVYTPNAGFSGTDTFTYTASDGFGGTITGTVTVTVSENQAPLARPDSVTILKGTTVDIPVLANDSDPENEALTVTAVGAAQQGDVRINADGSIRYAHRPGSQGEDSFSYTVRDASGRTAMSTVTVRVVRVIVPGNG